MVTRIHISGKRTRLTQKQVDHYSPYSPFERDLAAVHSDATVAVIAVLVAAATVV